MSGGARDASEALVASTGNVFVADVGATAPTDADSPLSAEWYNLGFATEDGVSFSHSLTIEEFAVWQSRQPIRREAVNTADSFTFAMAQWNAETVKFAFGGGVVTQTAPGEYKYAFPADDDSLDERAIVVDFQDGDALIGRLHFQRGSITEAVEVQFVRSALAVLPVTFSVLAPTGGGSPGDWWFSSTAFHS